MKKLLLLIFIIFLTISKSYADYDYKGQIEKSDIHSEGKNMTGKYVKPSKPLAVKINVSKVIDSELSKNNEEFFARVTREVEIDDGILIPAESIIHGIIKASPSGKFGNDGFIKLKADYIVTPDGEQRTIEGEMTTKINPVADIAGDLTERTVYTLTGAVLGSSAALNLFGFDSAIISSGTTIGAGAAIGALGGICFPIGQKGKNVMILPDDELILKVKFPSKAPIYKKNAFKSEDFFEKDFFVEIKNIEYKKNSYNTTDNLCLDLKISNKTDKKADIFSLYVLDAKGNKYYANVFQDEKLRDFCILPQKTSEMIVPFAVEKVNDYLWLVFEFDNKIFAKLSISNAYNSLSKETKDKNNKMLEVKKNFYRVETPFD